MLEQPVYSCYNGLEVNKMDEMMQAALAEARQAAAEGETPVGAVLVKEGRILARAHNMREQTGDPTAHA